MKLLGSTKSKVTKYENDKNVPCSEIARIVLVYCNIVNNNYQHNSRVLHAFVPNILFGRLQDISSKNLIFWKTVNSEYSYIEVWFTNQN